MTLEPLLGSTALHRADVSWNTSSVQARGHRCQHPMIWQDTLFFKFSATYQMHQPINSKSFTQALVLSLSRALSLIVSHSPSLLHSRKLVHRISHTPTCPHIICYSHNCTNRHQVNSARRRHSKPDFDLNVQAKVLLRTFGLLPESFQAKTFA